MSTVDLTSAELISELIAETIRGNVGAVGALVRDVPAPDPRRLIRKLISLREEEDIDLRIAYLRPEGREIAGDIGIDADIFSHEVEQAERWRNKRDLGALIVVIAHGDEAKLSSLEEFTAVTSRDLKSALVDRALGEEAGKNDVQVRWWKMLGEDEGIGLAQLVDYYLSLSNKKDDAFFGASSREIFRLGLLSDPGLFDDPHERAVRKRIKENHELLRRLQTLTPKDRRKIAQRIDSIEGLEERKQLREALNRLHRTRWQEEGMPSIDFRVAKRLVKPPKKRRKEEDEDDTPSPSTEKVIDVAAEALVDENRAPDTEAIVEGLSGHLNNLDEQRLRPEPVATGLPDSGSEAVTKARLDVINFMSKLLDDGVYGGLVEIEAADLGDALLRFEDQQHVAARWERDRIAGFLAHLSVDDAGSELAVRFKAYDEARREVLPLWRSLTTEPLAVAANTGTRTRLLALIEAYEAINRTALKHYERLFDKFGSDVHEVLGHLLLLETAIVRATDQTYAVVAPTHPLWLWHYARYCQTVEEQRDRLEDRDKELVVQAAKDLPNFITSVFVPPTVFEVGITLPYLGRLGSLPYFGEKVEVSASDDGVETIRKLIEAHLALEPHSQLGFRLALVDPPDAGAY